jgi:hypothetical protein
LRVLDPPFPIPTIEVKQLWHRRFDGHPRLKCFATSLLRCVRTGRSWASGE